MCSLLCPRLIPGQDVGFGSSPKIHRAAGGTSVPCSSLGSTPLPQGKAKVQTASVLIDGVLQGIPSLLCWKLGHGCRTMTQRWTSLGAIPPPPLQTGLVPVIQLVVGRLSDGRSRAVVRAEPAIKPLQRYAPHMPPSLCLRLLGLS